jgi:hypothetical protein
MSVRMKRRRFVLGGDVDAHACNLGECARRIGRGTDSADDALLELGDAILDGFEEQLFLVAEVIVERALRDAGRTGDAVDRRALVAVACEAIDGDRHQLLAAPSLRLRAGSLKEERDGRRVAGSARGDILNDKYGLGRLSQRG